MKMEVWRRGILLVGATLGITLAMYASLSPKVALKAVDFAYNQKHEAGFSDQAKYLRQLPLEGYIEEKLKGRHTVVEGGPWQAFFAKVLAASRGEATGAEFRRRTRIENRHSQPPYEVFFLPADAPIDDIAENLAGTNSEIHYLVLNRPGGSEYLQAVYRTYGTDSFGFGTGVHYAPPAALLHPYRWAGFGLIGLGLAAYIALPRRRRASDVICFPQWTVVPGDLVGLVLFVPFFALPMLIIGGAVQAVMYAWFLCIMMWPLAFLGAWLLMHMAEYASYELRIVEGGIERVTTRGRTTVPFESMALAQPLVLQPPTWLIVLSRLGAMAARGADRFRMAGQAMLLGGQETNGLSLRMKDGSAVYVQLLGQPNGRAEDHSARFAGALEAAGVPWSDEPKVIKGMVMPDGKGPGGTRLRDRRERVLLGLAAFPFAAMAAVLIGLGTMSLLDSLDIGHSFDSTWEDDLKQAEMGRFPADEVAWEKRFRCGPSPMLLANLKEWEAGGIGDGRPENEYNTYALGVVPMSDGGCLIFGGTGPTSHLDGFAIRTDKDGNPLWQEHYGAEGRQPNWITGACVGQDGVALLFGTTGSPSSYADGSRVYLVRLSDSGRPQWDLLWGNEKESLTPCDVLLAADGSLIVAGTVHAVTSHQPSTTVFRLQVGADGRIVAEARFDTEKDLGQAELAWVTIVQDGGLVVTGTIIEPDRFKDVLLARYSENGDVRWNRAFGGPKLETGRKVISLSDGGWLVAGHVDSFDDAVQPYLVRVGAEGQLVWEETLGGDGCYEIRDVQPASDGGFLLAGDYRPTQDAPPRLFVLKVDAAGAVDWQKQLEQPHVVYMGKSAVQAADGSILVLADRMWRDGASHAASLSRLRQ